MIAGIIPGPRNPWDIHSFLFPILREVKAIQHLPLLVPGTATPFTILLGQITGDKPSIAKAANLTGHNSVKPCWSGWCDWTSMRPNKGSTFYAAPTRPADLEEGAHLQQDLDLAQPPRRVNQYFPQLRKLLSAVTSTARLLVQRATGLVGSSMFSALGYVGPHFPTCCLLDPMHLLTLNLGSWMLELYRGQLKTADTEAGPWATLARPEVFASLSELVVNASRYLPYDFGKSACELRLTGCAR